MMNPASIETALGDFQAGRLDQAESVCRQILRDRPDSVDAMNLLASVLTQAGRVSEAVDLFQQAIRLAPTSAGMYGNLGNTLGFLGRWSEACEAYRRAVELKPDFTPIINDLGNALCRLGRFGEAAGCFRRVVTQQPDHVQAWNNLGSALLMLDRFFEAEDAFSQAARRRPGDADHWYNLGIAFEGEKKTGQAVEAFGKAISMRPEFVEAAIKMAGQLRKLQRWDDAIFAYRQALKYRPDFVDALGNLGITLKDVGELDEAMQCLDRVVAIDPEHISGQNARCYVLNFHPKYDSESILREHSGWRRLAAKWGAAGSAHSNDRNPDRRLRIGYVSGDFRRHPVGFAIEPLLANHDHRQFEIFCFDNGPYVDDISERIQPLADHWHPIQSLEDDRAAELVRDCGIDILVDLSLHMLFNRLPVFARKPAPIQVAYLGYPGTTGMDAMDYRLSDPYIDPDGTPRHYAEQTLRLPRTYMTWRWNGVAEPVAPVPFAANGFLTFASLNNFCKVTANVLETWGRIMARVPNSRLLLRCPAGSGAQGVTQTLAKFGVAPNRVEIINYVPDEQYASVFSRMDIMLDPFPYGGHTTSLDGMWMGVPLVTLAGRTSVGRTGASLLRSIGLPELIAKDNEQYIQIACGLAADPGRLQMLRSEMRSRLQRSPIMDEAGFARDLESAYRGVWKKWCGTRPETRAVLI